MEGFTPDEDATVVTRMLDAGAEIAGKATCENMSFSGGSTHPSPSLYATRGTQHAWQAVHPVVARR